MKKTLPTLILIGALIFNPLSATRVFAQTTDDSCSVTNPFGCLGQAVNTAVIGFADRAAEEMLRYTGDFLESLLNAIAVVFGGVGNGRCLTDGDCATEERCDTTQAEPLCVPRSTSLREEYLAALQTNPYLQGGAIGATGRTMALVYANPLDIKVGDFFQKALANNILSPRPAYGQSGTTFLSTAKITDLWKAFRNLSYLLTAVVLAIAGIMVMLRAKTDPRTVVTFQAALPRVAVALVLIYFSWPIAGLLMDLGNILTQLVKSIFTGNISIAGAPMDIGLGAIWSNFTLRRISIDFGSRIAELLFRVAVFILTFIIAFGILWTLISRYGSLFILAIFAPLAFLFGALPGREEVISRWFKMYLVNVLVFPSMYLIINVANYIRLLSTSGGARFPLPFLTGTADIGGLLAVGLLAMSLRIPGLLEEVLDIQPSRARGFEAGSIMRGIPIIGGLFG